MSSENLSLLCCRVNAGRAFVAEKLGVLDVFREEMGFFDLELRTGGPDISKLDSPFGEVEKRSSAEAAVRFPLKTG